MAVKKGEASRCRWLSGRDEGGAARVVVLAHGIYTASAVSAKGMASTARAGTVTWSPNLCDGVAVATGDDFLCAESSEATAQAQRAW